MITMEPMDNMHRRRQMLKEACRAYADHPEDYITVVIAQHLKAHGQETDNETALALGDLLATIQLRQDEPRFSAYDYADAVENHPDAPTPAQLVRWFKTCKDTDIWDRLIIRMAEDKRETYSRDITSEFLTAAELKDILSKQTTETNDGYSG